MYSLIKKGSMRISDAFAFSMTRFFRLIADSFFLKRYGHRAVVRDSCWCSGYGCWSLDAF